MSKAVLIVLCGPRTAISLRTRGFWYCGVPPLMYNQVEVGLMRLQKGSYGKSTRYVSRPESFHVSFVRDVRCADRLGARVPFGVDQFD